MIEDRKDDVGCLSLGVGSSRDALEKKAEIEYVNKLGKMPNDMNRLIWSLWSLRLCIFVLTEYSQGIYSYL